MLESARAEALCYSSVKLFSKYSNLCKNHALTSQTDRQTDLLWHNRFLRTDGTVRSIAR